MNKPAWRRLLALLFAFTMVAAACGGGDDDGTEAGSDEGGTDTTEAMEDEPEEEDDGENKDTKTEDNKDVAEKEAEQPKNGSAADPERFNRKRPLEEYDQEKGKKEEEETTFLTGVPLITMPGHTGYLTFATLPAKPQKVSAE